MTSRGDIYRTAANTNETLLTPANVNTNSFGKLFSYTGLDYQVLAQPLYVPNVQFPGQGTHNVVYVATMADSVYAFDADSPAGTNGLPLWQVNFTDPQNGITLASYADKTLPCTNANSTGPGFNREGIVSTPVIDPATGTMYVVAKTVEGGTVTHRLHALDITSGLEKQPSVTIGASIKNNSGKSVNFNSLHQKNRPGLLLLNGMIYMAFGSNYCNDHNTSWVLGYNAADFTQPPVVFDVNPDHGLSSIWQSGQGIAADDQGNIYVTSSEGNFDPLHDDLASSVIKLSTSPFGLADYFTPADQSILSQKDLDLSSNGVLVLPDQPQAPTHIMLAAGKQGTLYVLNRDPGQMGGYNGPAGPDLIVQELPFAVGALFDSPAYWNGMVYYAANADPIKAFAVNNSGLSVLPVVMSTQKYVGAHSPSISANGTTNGILWVMSGQRLYAFDALSLQPLYSTAAGVLPKTAHFATQTVMNGKVYVATQTSLEVYGLLPAVAPTGGNNQIAAVLTTLPTPLQVQAADPYSGTPIPGATVQFSDGGKGGVFTPASGVTDSSGYFSTTYTLPKKTGTYSITASSPGLASAFFTETAAAGPVAKLSFKSGGGQSGTVGTVLPNSLSVRAVDANQNSVPGVSVTFDDKNSGGQFTQNPVVTDATGMANVQYQLPTHPGTFTVNASATGVKNVHVSETAVAGPPQSITVTGGNNQTAPAGTQLPQALTTLVTDQYNNPLVAVPVTFDDGGAGGSFVLPNPANTDGSGTATQFYILPPAPGTVTITASVGGVSQPAIFTETGQ